MRRGPAQHGHPKPFVWTKTADEILCRRFKTGRELLTCFPREFFVV
jgi:hypothetical protein